MGLNLRQHRHQDRRLRQHLLHIADVVLFLYADRDLLNVNLVVQGIVFVPVKIIINSNYQFYKIKRVT